MSEAFSPIIMAGAAVVPPQVGGDAQTLHAVHPKPLIDHRVRVRSHLAGAHGMENGRRVFQYILAQIIVGGGSFGLVVERFILLKWLGFQNAAGFLEALQKRFHIFRLFEKMWVDNRCKTIAVLGERDTAPAFGAQQYGCHRVAVAIGD